MTTLVSSTAVFTEEVSVTISEEDRIWVSFGRVEAAADRFPGSPRPTITPAHLRNDKLLALLGRVLFSRSLFRTGISIADIGVAGRGVVSSSSTLAGGPVMKAASFIASASISRTAFSSSTISRGISE